MTALLFLIAAPVPPPRPLTAELLVGRWEWRWGTLEPGWIEFGADGRYTSRHSQGDCPNYCGRWLVRDGVLTLYEGRAPEPGTHEAAEWHQKYDVSMDTRRYPALTGKCGVTVVKLSNPRRPK